MMPFLKMHGLGNDFALFDTRKQPLSLTSVQARAIADRRLGIGCDQVILIGEGSDGAHACMRIYNADGSEVESCGNAARCVARLLMEEDGINSVILDTKGGRISCAANGNLVRVDMGVPRFNWQDIPLSEPYSTLCFWIEAASLDEPALREAAAANVGNPHCILFVSDAERAPVEKVGPVLENHPLFPQGANVEFVQVVSSGHLRMRVWERGAGITPACGTGACAAVAAAQRRKLCGTRAEVRLDGGTLVIEWQGEGSPVFMTGPATFSFRGEVDLGSLT